LANVARKFKFVIPGLEIFDNTTRLKFTSWRAYLDAVLVYAKEIGSSSD